MGVSIHKHVRLQRLQQAALAQGLRLQAELKHREPAPEILAMAETVQADLIVVVSTIIKLYLLSK